MPLSKLGSAVLTVMLLAGANTASAQETFESFALPNNTQLPGGFGGFNWSNFYGYDAVTAGFCSVPTVTDLGYCAVTSGTHAAYNAFGNDANVSNTSPFIFGGAWLSAAFTSNGNLSGDPRANAATAVQLTGFLGATQVYQTSFNIIFNNPLFFTANWTGIDKVVFSSRPNPGSSAQFVMDDIYFTRVGGGNDVVPEPATMSLLATGLAGMAAARRRRKKA